MSVATKDFDARKIRGGDWMEGHHYFVPIFQGHTTDLQEAAEEIERVGIRIAFFRRANFASSGLFFRSGDALGGEAIFLLREFIPLLVGTYK